MAGTLALLSWAGALNAPAALAHSFTKTDGNDTPGKLDLASVSVGHRRGSIVYTFRARSRWTNVSLGRRSFLAIQIDKDGDRDYERCAFIFYDNRLRGSLTNCGDNFIDALAVSRPSGRAARLVLSPRNVANLGADYWWFGATRWFGPAPCRAGCTDFVPNRYPDLYHDLAPPDISMPTGPLRVWETSTTSEFPFPFTVTDDETGVRSWTVQSRPIGTTTWTVVASGSGEGGHEPPIGGLEDGQYQFRVVAFDSQGNRRIGPIRLVYVPVDVTTAGPGTVVGGLDTPDANAYGGSYVALDDVSDSYMYAYDQIEGGPCRRFELIGPGSGTWEVQVTDGVSTTTLSAATFADAQRQTLYSVELCADTTLTFTVVSGTGFGVDAILR